MPDLSAIYLEKIAKTSSQISAINKNLNYASIIRLCAFFVILLCTYQLFHEYSWQKSIQLILALSSFLASITWFVNLKKAKNKLQVLQEVLQNEWNHLHEIPNIFANGADLDTGESFWGDLDLFGKSGLFHHLNRTSTLYGYTALANQLKYPFINSKSIQDAQSAVAVYSSQIELVENIITVSRENKTEFRSLESVNDWLQSENRFHQYAWIQPIRFAFPILNVCLLFYALITGDLKYLGITFLLGWILIGVFAKYLQNGFQILSNKEQILQQYASILELFSKVKTEDSQLLKEYQANALEAFNAIRDLSKLSSRIDQRINILIISFFNPYFLYDIQNMYALESWKIKYKKHFNEWMEVVGKIEMMNCFATYAYQNPENVYPTISQENLRLSIADMSHPLIPRASGISNSIEIGNPEKLLLITGSNMSGKTTFLRTLGVNLVMAQSGLPVCAGGFIFSPMNLFSSIRISDSLQEHTSYFMAELKKLKALKMGVQIGTSSLVLIDEILRGTNSDDKYQGSAAFVKELIQFNCLSLFATHDLKLGEMEKEYPSQIANYCFESTIENNILLFDYKIRKGIAQNKNATFLMKQMDII